MIHVVCATCEQKFKAPAKYAGSRVRCPKCKSPIQVPQTVNHSPVGPTPVTPANPAPLAPISESQLPPETLPPMAIPIPASTKSPAPIRPAPAPSPPPAAPVAGTLRSSTTDDIAIATNNASVAERRRRKSPTALYVVIGCLVIVGILGGVAAIVLRSPSVPKLAFQPVSQQNIHEHQSITIPLSPTDGYWEQRLVYRFQAAPAEATIDSETGSVQWTPTEDMGGTTVPFMVVANAQEANNDTSEKIEFSIQVTEHNSRPQIEPMAPITATVGEALEIQVVAGDSDLPRQALRYFINNDRAIGAMINEQSGNLIWTPDESFLNRRTPIRVKVVEAGDGGLESVSQIIVSVVAAQSSAPTTAMGSAAERAKGAAAVAATAAMGAAKESVSAEPPTTGSGTSSSTAETPPGGPDFDAIAELFAQKKRLFEEKSYFTLRKYFAATIAAEFESEIQTNLGDDWDELKTWLDAHDDIREELYTAISPEHDSVGDVFRIFDAIRRSHPKRIEAYGGLAIACSLVWDRPQRAVYHYGGHCARCKSKMSTELIEAVENFAYFVMAENFMQGRAQFMPWEFLVHIVNHRTPLAERQWAMSNYVQKRVMFGTCYHDVPYDGKMLSSGSKVARMNDKDYTLPNLREFGGVCAMQADFAARVGKSLGVPAAYVSGEGRFGGSHAWVMWVELQGVTAKSIAFRLKSHGRYRGDHYYVGHLRDPQTGQGLTDRQLELRLHIAGTHALNKRHADLLMSSMPILQARAPWDLNDRLAFLRSVLETSPGNERAWRSVAQLASAPEFQEKKRKKQMVAILDSFFLTFANFPDFTWEIFDALIAFEADATQRLAFYDRLSLLYGMAKRPDLACKARVKLADLLVEGGRREDAIQGLALTIQAFPNEGRYVPRMLDKLEEACQGMPGADEQLLAFYANFLPKVDKFRSNAPSQYCIKMHERIIERLKQYNQPQAVAYYESQLAMVKAGKK